MHDIAISSCEAAQNIVSGGYLHWHLTIITRITIVFSACYTHRYQKTDISQFLGEDRYWY